MKFLRRMVALVNIILVGTTPYQASIAETKTSIQEFQQSAAGEKLLEIMSHFEQQGVKFFDEAKRPLNLENIVSKIDKKFFVTMPLEGHKYAYLGLSFEFIQIPDALDRHLLQQHLVIGLLDSKLEKEFASTAINLEEIKLPSPDHENFDPQESVQSVMKAVVQATHSLEVNLKKYIYQEAKKLKGKSSFLEKFSPKNLLEVIFPSAQATTLMTGLISKVVYPIVTFIFVVILTKPLSLSWFVVKKTAQITCRKQKGLLSFSGWARALVCVGTPAAAGTFIALNFEEIKNWVTNPENHQKAVDTTVEVLVNDVIPAVEKTIEFAVDLMVKSLSKKNYEQQITP